MADKTAASDADIKLLFGVAGGGDIHGASGAKIAGELDGIVSKLGPYDIKFKINKNTKEKLNELEQSIGKIVTATGTIATNFDNIFNGLSPVLDRAKEVATQLERIGAVAANGSVALPVPASQNVDQTAEAYRTLLSLLDQWGEKSRQRALLDPVTDTGKIEETTQSVSRLYKEIALLYAANEKNFTPDQRDAITKYRDEVNRTVQDIIKGQTASENFAKASSYISDIKRLSMQSEREKQAGNTNTVATLKAQIDQLDTSYKNLVASGTMTQTQLAELDSLYKEATQDVQNYSDVLNSKAMDSADKQQTADTVREIVKQYGELEKMYEKLGNIDQTQNVNEFKELSRQIDETKQNIDTMRQSLQGKVPQSVLDDLDEKAQKADNALALATARLKDLGKQRPDPSGTMSRLDYMIVRALTLENVLIKLYRQIKQMINVTIELNSAMTQLQIVTDNSVDEVRKYGETIAGVAKDIGASITDLIDSTTVFARLGYSLDESTVLSKYSAMLKNVGDIEIGDAQDALTAITKAFNISANDIESVMDKMVMVGNNFPISVSQIATGMNNAGSALAAAGNSFEESVALLTAANTTVQNVSKAATGLRTLTARIRRTKVELDDLGESIETAKYEEVIQALTKHNVSLVDLNGNYRTTYDILKDISAIWDDLSNIEQAAVAEQLAGTRQQNVFFSIINQFKEATSAMDAMGSSSGSLTEAYDEYMISMKAHTDMFKAAYQELAQTIMSSNLIKFVTDVGTKALSLLSKITGALNKLALITKNIPVLLKALRIHQVTGLVSGQRLLLMRLVEASQYWLQ